MKRGRAVTHLAEMAVECALIAERLEMFEATDRMLSLWAWGEVLDGWPEEQRSAKAAVVFEAPAARVPWCSRPSNLEFAADLTGWSKRPVHLMFRSSEIPVWNHEIVRPLRLWDCEAGVDELAIAALREGDVASRRQKAPTPDELREQLEAERAASYAAMVATTEAYDVDRWKRGDLRPIAEPLWEAAAGYVDLTEALSQLHA